MDGAMQKALAAHKDQAAGSCLDENILAAYMEARLDPSERQRVENHASNCVSCQELMGLALRLFEPEAELEAAEAAESPSKKVLFHFTLPVSVLAMIVLTLGAGYLFFRVLRESTPIQTAPHVAELRSPAKPEGISAPKSQAVSPPKEKAVPSEQQTEASAREPQRSKARLTPKVTLPPPTTEIALAREPATQPPPVLEPTPPVAVRALEARAEGGAADKSSVIAANLGESRPAGAGAVSPGVGRMNLAAARPEAPLKVQAVAQFSPEFTPRDAVLNLARLVPSERNTLLETKLRDRTFYFNSGYWIDGQCTEHPNGEFAEIKSDSADHEQIMKSLPDLRKMRPAIVYWDAKNCIIR